MFDSKPTVEDYERCMLELFHEQEPDPKSFEDPNDFYQWQEYNSERYDNQMSSHFGSGYKKKLEEFKTKCFKSTTSSDIRAEAKMPPRSIRQSKTTISKSIKVRNKANGKRRKK